MNLHIEKVLEIITAQQGADQNSQIFWVGEQLKDICKTTPGAAQLVATDLENNSEMTITAAERKIAEYAGAHKFGGAGCCPPHASDKILREFFGLATEDTPRVKPAGGAPILNLSDFM